jgi:hypothetical protein
MRALNEGQKIAYEVVADSRPRNRVGLPGLEWWS